MQSVSAKRSTRDRTMDPDVVAVIFRQGTLLAITAR